MAKLPVYSDLLDAERTIQKYRVKTPVLTSTQADNAARCTVYFKCENFQRTGAFKFRGAANAVFSLSGEEAANGVTTHSSGNHAQAVSLAAAIRGVKAYVVMPENSASVKIEAVKQYGADITFCKPTQQAREAGARKITESTGATFIHPYDNPAIIAGQGTAALELLREIPDLDYIVTPVGGGGLISGTVTAVNGLQKKTHVAGAEPEGANDAQRSLEAGSLIQTGRTDTIADGLRASLGKLTFEIIRKNVDTIATVPDSSLVRDMRFLWERLNIIVEPSSVVPFSALVDRKLPCDGKKVGVILTGGNVDLDRLPWQAI